MKLFYKLVFGLSLCLVNDISYANLIDSGNITIDQATGLRWLDLSETFGRSHVDISSQLNVGREFEGYRYASSDEVLTLLNNAGVTGYVNGFNAFNYRPLVELTDLLVNTPLSGTELWIGGTFGTTNNIHPTYGPYVDLNFLIINHQDRTGGTAESAIRANSIDYSTGHWLVAEQIPEPNTIALIGSAFLVLYYIRKK